MSNLRLALGSAGQRALSCTRAGYDHFSAALARIRSARPATTATAATAADDAEAEAEQVKEHLSEHSISSQLLRISAVAVALKALHYFVDRKWVQTATSAGSLILETPLWIWSMITSLALVPILCALTMAIITWCTVSLDRCIPGISPPHSGTVNKRWFLTPATLHLGHVIAVANGFLLALLFYFGGNDSTYL